MNWKPYDLLIIGGACLCIVLVVWDRLQDSKAAKEEREYNGKQAIPESGSGSDGES